MFATVLEAESRAGDEISDRARHDDLTVARLTQHPRPDVDGEPCRLRPYEFALACVHAGAHGQVARRRDLDDGARARDRPSGAVEAAEETITRAVYLDPPESSQLTPDVAMMLVEKLAPCPIAEPSGGRR